MKLFRSRQAVSSIISTILGFAILAWVDCPQAFSQANEWNHTRPAWAVDRMKMRRAAPQRTTNYYDLQPYAPGSHNIAIDVGQVFLMGDLTEYDNSIGFRVHYTYGVSDIFGFDTSFGFSSHENERAESLSMTQFLAGVRTNLSWFDRLIPYVVFGLGFYRPSKELPDASSASALLFGLHVGPGIDLQISNDMFFGAGLTFHDIFGTKKLTADGSKIELGGSFTSFLLHAGYTF